MLRRLWLIFAQAVTVALALLFVVQTLKPQWLGSGRVALGPRTGSAAAAAPLPAPVVLPPRPVIGASAVSATAASTTMVVPPGSSLAAAANAASPAVVSVTTALARSRDDGWPVMQRQPAAGFGSGVLVAREGLVLTNHHVIDGAREIEVTLADGREAPAKVLGTDPETDLAVLKVELKDLPAIVFGDSTRLQVGDTVLAIGNPFNVGQTVTSGIVSALGRNGLGLSTFESFIQTDAAINPGNSGGALVDDQGRLIGINTAIFSRSGGSTGIGFAIPVDLARRVMQDLVEGGQVRRGWIGVELRELTPAFIESFHLPVRSGVLVTGVMRGGPADRAGLQPGDVITSLASQPITTMQQLRLAIAALPPGRPAQVAVQRGEAPVQMTVDVMQRAPQPVPGR